MTALTCEYHRPSPAPLLWIAFLGLVLAVALGVHAFSKHGEAAETVRNCLQQNGPDALYVNPNTGRLIRCVKLPDGKWGVQVVECNDGILCEVTSFIKEKLGNKIDRYMQNGGAERLEP